MQRYFWWLVAVAAVLASCGAGDVVRPGAGAIRALGAIRNVADANQPIAPGDPAFAANIAIGKKFIESLYASRRSSNSLTPAAASTQQPFCTVPAGSSFTDCYFFALNDSVNVGIAATLPTGESPANYAVEDPTHSGESMRTYVNDFSDPSGPKGSTFSLAYNAGYAPATATDNANLSFPSSTPLPEYDVYAASHQSNYLGTLTLKALESPPSNTVNGTCEIVYGAEANIIPQIGNPQGSFFDLGPQIQTYLISPPCPTATPTPESTPIAAVAVSQLAGDFTQDVNGTVAIYVTPPPGDIAFVPPGTGTATASVSRDTSSLPTPAPLPSGYRTAPPNLPENNAAQTAFVNKLISFTTPGKLVPGCEGFIEEQRADPTSLSDPKNPAYYQIQTYCAQGASIASNAVVSTWTGTDYNGTVTATGTMAQTCTPQPTSSVLSVTLTKCFTPVSLVPLVLGHAERNEPIALHFNVNSYGAVYPFDTFRFPLLNLTISDVGTVSSFNLNNRSVPYPMVSAAASWGPPSSIDDGNVTPPTFTSGMPWVYTAKGCDPNDGDTGGKLGTALANAGYPNPVPGKTVTPTSPAVYTTFDAHHLQPSCFAGSNVASNGIWLPNLRNAQYGNIHQIFSTWFYTAGLSSNRTNFTP